MHRSLHVRRGVSLRAPFDRRIEKEKRRKTITRSSTKKCINQYAEYPECNFSRSTVRAVENLVLFEQLTPSQIVVYVTNESFYPDVFRLSLSSSEERS
ncbi:hypothetical protein WN51_13369 [Melipona quadrifasciata]|uniref:Uncharacterized protein n=1 Tax=Melipona quadrifasciata TaxID=166423 RepID=A0A0N0BGN9_9HYME|nr:hypothetical protein WN51_13369 [Melipona quadrifasciata]